MGHCETAAERRRAIWRLWDCELDRAKFLNRKVSLTKDVSTSSGRELWLVCVRYKKVPFVAKIVSHSQILRDTADHVHFQGSTTSRWSGDEARGINKPSFNPPQPHDFSTGAIPSSLPFPPRRMTAGTSAMRYPHSLQVSQF